MLAVLIPVTRERYIAETLDSLLAQTVPPLEVRILDNRGSGAPPLGIGAFIRTCRARGVDVTYTSTCQAGTVRTSEAVRLLLEQVRLAPYATILADDDSLSPLFVATFQSALQGVGVDSILSCDLIGFTEDLRSGGDYIDVSRSCSQFRLLNRLSSGVSGLIPGGGTVFPVELARSLQVFDSPVPIVAEDQLMSTRFFRNYVPWVHVPEPLYFYRQYLGRTSGETQLGSFALGVVRGVRIQEESLWILRALTYAAGVRERLSVFGVGRHAYDSGLCAVSPRFLTQLEASHRIAAPFLRPGVGLKRAIWGLQRRLWSKRLLPSRPSGTQRARRRH